MSKEYRPPTPPLVLDFDRGTSAAERLLRAAIDGREGITFRLPRSATNIRPGLILPVQIGNEPPRLMIVERVVEGADLAIEARSYSLGSYAPTGGVHRQSTALAVRGSSAVLTIFLDLPILPGTTADEWDTLVAHHSDPWPGSIVFARSRDAAGGFIPAGESPLRSAVGEITSSLPTPGQQGLWQAASFNVKLNSGTLVTRSEFDVLSGLNALAIQHSGGWEVLQFREVQLIGSREWRLTGLLRGQLGTEVNIDAAALPATAPVVLLNAALQPIGLDVADVSVPRFHRIGPSRAGISSHGVHPHTGLAIGWRPYAPCHLTAKQSGGDVVLSWIRRTRIDGEADWRDGVLDVPLGETRERYLIEVVSGATVMRQSEVITPAFTYTAADAAADGMSAPYTIRVAQVSESYGPGGWTAINIS